MTLDAAVKILQPSLIKTLHRINICGNYGDGITNLDIIPIILHVRSLNPKIEIKLATNGGARNVSFWEKAAELVDHVYFAIDGLEDTNHLYRQFVNWELLERNVNAYVKKSNELSKTDHSTWEMNVFKHNEHQVEKARSLSKQWGISKFQERYTDRFFNASTSKTFNWPVYDDQGNVRHIIHPATVNTPENLVIDEVTDKTDTMAHNIDVLKKLSKKGKFDITNEMLIEEEKTIKDGEIDCKVKKRKSIYIDHQGKLYPCCWFGAAEQHQREIRSQQIMQMYEEFGDAFNDLKLNSIESIFSSGIFQEIERRWYRENVSSGKPIMCVKRCGNNSVKNKVV